MTFTNKRSLIALLLSIVLVVSLFTIGVSATESTSSDIEEVVTTEAVESDTENSDESVSGTAAADSKEETTAKKEETTTKKEETTTKNEETTVDKNLVKSRAIIKKSLIINSIILGVIIVLCVVLVIKFRKKLDDFIRSVKSELKKIVWSSKDNTRKSFLVVLVVAIAVALTLWLIDIAFNTGISEIAKLLK